MKCRRERAPVRRVGALSPQRLADDEMAAWCQRSRAARRPSDTPRGRKPQGCSGEPSAGMLLASEQLRASEAVPPPTGGRGRQRQASAARETTLAPAERTAPTARAGFSPWERLTTAPAN